MTKSETREWYPSPRYLLRRKLIVKSLKSINCAGKSILEIGYGAGDTLCTYSKLGMEVYGYDYSELAKKEATKRFLKSKISGGGKTLLHSRRGF